jgi:hypothetical protein
VPRQEYRRAHQDRWPAFWGDWFHILRRASIIATSVGRYLEQIWIKYVKCLWAFFNWVNHGRPFEGVARPLITKGLADSSSRYPSNHDDRSNDRWNYVRTGIRQLVRQIGSTYILRSSASLRCREGVQPRNDFK